FDNGMFFGGPCIDSHGDVAAYLIDPDLGTGIYAGTKSGVSLVHQGAIGPTEGHANCVISESGQPVYALPTASTYGGTIMVGSQVAQTAPGLAVEVKGIDAGGNVLYGIGQYGFGSSVVDFHSFQPSGNALVGVASGLTTGQFIANLAPQG